MSINIQGIHDGNNFIVDSIAKYVRDNNYPEWAGQFIVITVNDGNKFSFIASKGNEYLCKGFKEDLKMFPDRFLSSSGVFYQEDSWSIYMLIDNYYYWVSW